MAVLYLNLFVSEACYEVVLYSEMLIDIEKHCTTSHKMSGSTISRA